MFSANSSQVSDDKLFVEDVFSTYLYTGNGSTQTITNGIDLAGKGGMVWTKPRSQAQNNGIIDTTRGITKWLSTNLLNGDSTYTTTITSVSSTGFTVGSDIDYNQSGTTMASWTFRKAPKFFDVVTYTGTGSFFRDLSHSLGVAPGFIVVKRTDTTSNWWTYHRGVVGSINGYLNLTDAFNNIGYVDPSPTPAATFRVFNTGAGDDLNVSGATYVAYLYAHDATSDGLIQCGSYVGNGASIGPTVNLGWEPQWLLIKRATDIENWVIYDNMRGVPVDGIDAQLSANLSNAEQSAQNRVDFTATGFVPRQGFTTTNATGDTYIYIAIRRGPMRTPTLGTSVFSPNFATSGAPWFKSGFPVDFGIFADRTNGGDKYTGSRITGEKYLVTNTTAAEGSDPFMKFDYMNGFKSDTTANSNYIGYSFRRAPGFFDVVCYTGNGVNGRTINHNLGVTPELMIMKNRSSAGYNWFTWDKSADLSQANALLALSNAAGRPAFSSGNLNSTVPTSTVFTIGGDSNASGNNYVTYLFASCPGVSNVGSYTGNGSSQTINCGFAAGARFVMIKRTDSTGDWYVWDTARGIVAGNDPHLSLNTTAAEVTSNDTIDTDSSGFVVNQVAATNVNVNAATYIYLAIA